MLAPHHRRSRRLRGARVQQQPTQPRRMRNPDHLTSSGTRTETETRTRTINLNCGPQACSLVFLPS